MRDIPAIRCGNLDQVNATGPGAFCVFGDFIFLVLPCGKEAVKLRIKGSGATPLFRLTGTADKPTLNPTIYSERWCGRLREGEFISW